MIRYPGEDLPEDYYNTRYEILRKPLGSPKGSEHLSGDEEAINVWVEDDNNTVAVGRAHLISESSDGSAVDVKAKSVCPAFEPLRLNAESILDDSGTVIPTNTRPAIQVRAMGTLDNYQGKGLASKVLGALEKESIALWNANTGWLQARIEAIPFYEANGWCCFGQKYFVPNVGPHRSMWKKF